MCMNTKSEGGGWVVYNKSLSAIWIHKSKHPSEERSLLMKGRLGIEF